jgi:two-component system, NtrC family, response regulator HydG
MPHAAVIDDDDDFREAMVEVVRQQGFTVETATTLAKARTLISERTPDVVLLDLSLPDGDGSQLLAQLNERPTDVVVITGNATVDSAIEALREGAADYLTKPIDAQRLRAILSNVARRRELSEQVNDLRAELRSLGRFGPLIGAAPTMQELYDLIARVAPTNATVLIEGESGTGKELVAQTIHQLSRRRKQPFVALNCGAVSPQLIESELFGHERGSFTGADRQHRGYFERAGGGTLFLDEITEMPVELQVRLLRSLETGAVVRIGGEKEIPVDVRIIAATNRNANQAVEAGSFRHDLLYRLSVFPLRLPALRERPTDIELLAESFLLEINRQEKTNKRLGRDALDLMRRYSWPGNVRELKNLVHRAFILADDEIGAPCLPTLTAASSAVEAAASSTGATASIVLRPGVSIAEAERKLILATLQAYEGNKEQTAKTLGISLKTLYNRLNAYNGRAKARDVSAPLERID